MHEEQQDNKSFAFRVKDEVANAPYESVEQMQAELNAFIKINGSIGMSNGKTECSITTDNKNTADRIGSLLKNLFPNIQLGFAIKRAMKLRKRQTYIIKVQDASKVLESVGVGFFYDTEFISNLLGNNDERKMAYMRAIFLACGSVNDPRGKSYHLELALSDKAFATFVLKILNKGKNYRMDAKIVERRGKYIVYIKKAENISDFLKLIGSTEMLFEFEDEKETRAFNISLIRMDNMDIANQVRTNTAANEIIETIDYIDNNYGLEYLDEKLQRIAALRLEHPEVSMSGLVGLYEKEYGETVSKSGINHAMRKLRELEVSIKERGEELAKQISRG